MITVVFYGNLKSYGTFKLHATSPADALNGLFSQISGLREKIRTGTFLIRLNGEIQYESSIADRFRQPENHAQIHIIPRTAGAGRAGQIIAGVALIGLAFFNPFGLAAGHALLSGMMTGGVGLLLGGVAQMLAKPPKLDGSQGQKASRNTAFSNLDNTAAQGQPVPLAYGVVYAGSRVISQGVESRRISQDGQSTMRVDNGWTINANIGTSATTANTANTTPTATHIAVSINKTFTAGTAAISPNGQPYNTDFTHDSVRARNYVANLTN